MTHPDDPPPAAVRALLATPDGIELLEEVARSTFSRAVRDRLTPAAFGLSAQGTGNAAFLEDLRSALAEFLLESPKVQAAVLCPDTPNPARYLETAFRRHWIDRIRRDRLDPFRNLRDYAMDVLRDDGRFHRRRAGKAYHYSRRPDSRPIAPLAGEDRAAVPFPGEIVAERSLSGIRRREAMVRLADHFWHGISGLFGGLPVWVPVNDLVRWLMDHTMTPEDRPAFEDLEGAARHLPARAEGTFDPGEVRRLAEVFGNRLKARWKPAFYLRRCQEMEYREVADTLGCSDQTGRNHVRAAQQEMARFLAEQPWLSPPDLDKAAFRLFFEILCRILERSPPPP